MHRSAQRSRVEELTLPFHHSTEHRKWNTTEWWAEKRNISRCSVLSRSHSYVIASLRYGLCSASITALAAWIVFLAKLWHFNYFIIREKSVFFQAIKNPGRFWWLCLKKGSQVIQRKLHTLLTLLCLLLFSYSKYHRHRTMTQWVCRHKVIHRCLPYNELGKLLLGGLPLPTFSQERFNVIQQSGRISLVWQQLTATASQRIHFFVCLVFSTNRLYRAVGAWTFIIM